MNDRVPDSRLRICLYTTRALPKRGGQELVVDALARELTVLGNYVVVLAPGTGHPYSTDSALPYQVVRHPRFLSTRWFVSWYRKFLIELNRTHHFDVIHCHGVYPAGYLGALGRNQLGIPLVLTNHSGNLESDPAWTRSATLRERHLHAFASADILIAISGHTADLSRRFTPVRKQIVTIPNGVDLDQFDKPAPRPLELGLDFAPGKYLLFLGRLRHSKGVDLLLKAIAQLEGSKRVSLVVGGSGREEKPLKLLALQLGIADQVKFSGWVTGDVRAYLLQNALCSVVPSREAEGFGLGALESMAAGRPVVASRVPGLSELVSDGDTGRLFDPDSAESLARTLDTLIADKELADRLGSAGKQYAQAYRWSTIAEQHLQLYRSLCNCRGTSPRSSVDRESNHESTGNHHATPTHS